MPKSNLKKAVSSKAMRSNEKATGIKMLQITVTSVCVGIASMMTASLALAFIMSKMPDPDIFLLPFVILTSAICGLFCGICAASISKKPMPYSLICGLVMIIIYFLISLIFEPTDYSTDMIFKTANIAVLPLSAVFGGVISTKKNKSKKRM